MSSHSNTAQQSADKGHTKVRHVRIPDPIWIGAAQRADAAGMTISEVTRELLRDYANGHIDVVRR